MLLIIPVILSYFPPMLKQADDQHMTPSSLRSDRLLAS